MLKIAEVSPMSDLVITAPNGVAWKRKPGSTSTGAEFLAALDGICGIDDVQHQWDWWQEGRSGREHELLLRVLRQWDHAEPPPGGYLSKEELEAHWATQRAQRDAERRARATSYNKERAIARVRLLSTEATVAFMSKVLAKPASRAQEAKAEELRAASEQEAATLREQVGEPDTVVDDSGDLPLKRREQNLSEHMTYFRHRLLREWSSGQRRRFNQLLAMRPPQPADMCSECQAPAEWHEYGLSVRLWVGRPEPGSTAETLSRLLPGWRERCPACTHYQLHHQWGHQALPDFGFEQWHAMLTPLLRAIFAPTKPAPRKPVDQRSALEKRIRAAEAEAKRLRLELSEIESRDE